jgi:two-component system NtrC family sensor kinase
MLYMINYYWRTREERTPMRLARRIFIDLMGVIVFISLFGTVVGAVLLSRSVRAEAFARVRNDLKAARRVLDDQLLYLSFAAELLVSGRIEDVELPVKPDLMRLVGIGEGEGRGTGKPGLTSRDPARDSGSLYRYLTENEHLDISKGGRGFVSIPISILEAEGFQSPKITARSACAGGSSFWLFATDEGTKGKGFAGVLLNGNEELVFGIQSTLFGEGMYGKKPFGTFTIFCGDRRVATTVIGPTGEIALGTTVSDVVRKKVLVEGQVWLDRAFVVDDWYLSAYEPIADIAGKTIGILYVGVLERKYLDIQRRVVLVLSAITLPALGLLLLGVFYLSRGIVKPVSMLADASKKIENGDFGSAVPEDGRVDEIRTLAHSFKSMADAIKNRENMLKQSNTELEEANRNYQELLSFVTHELNNSIGSLLLNVAILNDGTVGELGAEQREVSELIQRDLERFRDMVRNYLNISRLEKGTLKYNPEKIDLKRSVVEPVLKRLKSRLEHAGIALRWDWPESAVLDVDAELMDICFSNLVINAVKYGSGWIELAAHKHDGGWVFGVKNGGPPIPAEKIPLLFRKYSRLVKSDDGAGLGLYLVRQIVERHGGEVWCESGEERGTGFYIRLGT